MAHPGAPAATAGDGGPPLTVGLYSLGWPPVHFANGVRPFSAPAATENRAGQSAAQPAVAR